MDDSRAGLSLAGLKNLCWVGVVWLRSVTATLENKPSIHCWEEPQRRAATKAFSLQHNANSCHACTLPNQRHKDAIYSYANTYSLETLLQSIEVKNIPVNYDTCQLKHDFTSWNFLLHFDWRYSMFMLLPKLRLKQNIYRNAEHPHGKVQVYSSRM